MLRKKRRTKHKPTELTCKTVFAIHLAEASEEKKTHTHTFALNEKKKQFFSVAIHNAIVALLIYMITMRFDPCLC